MAIREIQAKVLLAHVSQPDPRFGLRYNVNLYRGCQHRCIYCDSRSECYQIEHFDGEVLVKANAVELLQRELARKRVVGTIGLGSMNAPYMPLEAEVNLTGRALQVIARFGFPVHIITKSDLVLKDLEPLCEIKRAYAAVSFTVTTADDNLAKRLEYGDRYDCPVPNADRLARVFYELCSRYGIATGMTPYQPGAAEQLRKCRPGRILSSRPGTETMLHYLLLTSCSNACSNPAASACLSVARRPSIRSSSTQS